VLLWVLLWVLDMVVRRLFDCCFSVSGVELLDFYERLDNAWLDGCLSYGVVMECERM
jgi:hypothetical protein